MVEEGPKQTLQTQQRKPYYLVTLSAKNSDVLKQRMQDLQTWITNHTQTSLEAIAYTLNAGRSHFNHRCALVIDSLADLQDKLQQLQEHPHKKIQGYFHGDATQEPEDKAIYDEVLAGLIEKLKTTHQKIRPSIKNICWL